MTFFVIFILLHLCDLRSSRMFEQRW